MSEQVILDDNSRWSFRQRARAWLAMAERDGNGGGRQTFRTGDARVLILDSGRLSSGQTVNAFVLVRGDFTCGAGCQFLRPVYAAGHCEIGKGSVLETLEVDGELHLAPGVEVRGDVTSRGAMEIRPGSRVNGMACSHTSVRLGLQASAKTIYATQVLTPDGVRSLAQPPAEPPSSVIPVLGAGRINRGLLKVAGFDPRRLHAQDDSSWFYDGDLHLARAVLLRSRLKVNGSASIMPGSLLEGDLEVARGLSIGPGSIVEGNLKARADIQIGRDVVFQGDIECGQMLRLCSGVRGLRSGAPVNVRSAGELALEEGVVIRGRLNSSCRVTAVANESFIASRRVAGGDG